MTVVVSTKLVDEKMRGQRTGTRVDIKHGKNLQRKSGRMKCCMGCGVDTFGVLCYKCRTHGV